MGTNNSLEKICKTIISYQRFNYYRIIKTPNKIEVKLTPTSNNENEVVYLVDNDRHSKLDLKHKLLAYVNN